MNSPEVNPPPAWASTNPLDPKWTEMANGLLKEGKIKSTYVVAESVHVALLEGRCPRCDCELLQQNVQSVVTPSFKSLESDVGPVPDKTIDVLFACNCPTHHHGPPAKLADGCGCGFRLRVVKVVKEYK